MRHDQPMVIQVLLTERGVVSIPPTKRTSALLPALLAVCVLTYPSIHIANAENVPLPSWDESGRGQAPDAALFPSRGDMFDGVSGDIFQGGNDLPEVAQPSSMFDSMPSAPSGPPLGRSGAVANLGSAVRNIQTGNPLGAFRAVGAAASQGPAAIPAVGQVVGGMGGSLQGGAGQIARTVQAGAQVIGGAAAIGSALGQFQRGGSGAQGAIGAIGNAVGVGQGLGSFGQGQPGNLQGILQGLGGSAASGALGNGIGAGPFGQFVGRNNEILQGLAFIALLQSLFGDLFHFGAEQEFNSSNTGESARIAFNNLLSPTSGIGSGAPSVSNPLIPGGGSNAFTNGIAGRVGEITSGVPGTDRGNLACAWVVNDVFRQVHGSTITGPNGNSLSVYETMQAMERQPQMFTSVTREQAEASGGDYIIASNYAYGGSGSHIGIGRGSTVWSNSSGRTSIQQNYTTGSWENHYGATRYYLVRQ